MIPMKIIRSVKKFLLMAARDHFPVIRDNRTFRGTSIDRNFYCIRFGNPDGRQAEAMRIFSEERPSGNPRFFGAGEEGNECRVVLK